MMRSALEKFIGNPRILALDRKISMRTPYIVKKFIPQPIKNRVGLVRWGAKFNNAGYSVERRSDEFYICGNGLCFTINNLGLAGEVILGREYEFDTGGFDWVVIDIGLNVGLTSLYLARKPEIKKIYSFEPYPTFDKAILNMGLNPELAQKIEAYHFGLSDIDVARNLPYDPKLSGCQSSISEKQNRLFGYSDQSAKIELRRASDVLAPIFADAGDSGRKVMIKIDCEGAEREIIPDLSAAGLLRRTGAIVMEYHDNYCDPLVEILERDGFSVGVTAVPRMDIGMIRANKGAQK